jgi:hypothetical protein
LVAAFAAVALFSMAASASAAGPNAVRTPDANSDQIDDCTTGIFAGNDDSSISNISIGFTANFWDASEFNKLIINNNGNVTVNDPVGEYTPFDFTTTGDVMIAPFLADVDTRAGDVVTYGTTTVNGHPAFCVNWVDVGYYQTHVDKTNSFQLVLISRPDTGDAGNFDMEFNYDRISWETGDASDGQNGFGGTSAEVGFANGDGDPSHYLIREGSFVNGALLDGGPNALIAGMQNSGGQLGRYVFPVRNQSTGTLLTGEVQSPEVDGFTPQPDAAVEICKNGGACTLRFANSSGVYRAANLGAGTYTITAHAPADGTEYADTTIQNVVISGTPDTQLTQDIILGDAPTGPPDGTTLEGIGESDGGLPVLYWSDSSPLATDVPDGCTPTSVEYTVTVGGLTVASGNMTENPTGSGHYTATIPPLLPASGPGLVHIDVNGDPPCNDIGFGIYIDPSGVVRNSNTGAVIPGADVTLFRSADADGPFLQVPSGSAIMSPGNRNNPDSTDENGHFGWDVLAGYYKVVAQADGCSPGSTAVMNIPPPVTDLDIGLSCPTGGGGGGGGGGGAAPAPLTTQPKAKKCKKKKKGKKAVAAKKCKKKKKRSASAASNPLEAGGLLFIGSSEQK